MCTCFGSSSGQNASTHALTLTRDKLATAGGFKLEKEWKISSDSATQFTNNECNDHRWTDSDPSLTVTGGFPDIKSRQRIPVWFRLAFTADTGITGTPLALDIAQLGASEIYIDGRLIGSFGKIAGKDNSTYYDPQDLPFTFSLQRAGPHLLLVHYANYDADKNYIRYAQPFAGFKMRIGFADQLMRADRTRSVFYTFMCLLMVGIFASLALSHLFLYAYHLAARSNLFFSIFCLGLAASFFIPFINRVSTNPQVELLNTYTDFVVKAFNCYALSGFINDLFSTSKKRFRVISCLCLGVMVFAFVFPAWGPPLFYLLLLVVASEATLLTARAMYRKVKGARILGSGLLLFVVFLIGFSFIKFHYNINDSDIAMHSSGKLYMLMIVLIMLCLPVSMSLYLAYNFAELNKSLMRSNKKLRELISFNAHQIREPLTRITGAMSVREYVDTAEEFMTEFMPQMEKAAHDLDNAIKGVLEKAQEQGE